MKSKVRLLQRFLSVEIPLLVVIGTLPSLLPVVSWRYWFSLALVGTCGAFIWAWQTSKEPHLIGDMLDSEEMGALILEVPVSYDIVAAASNHARNVYGRESLSLSEYAALWERNRWILAALRSESGEYLGYFDIFPLTDEGLQLIESGRYVEKDLKADHILPPSKMKRAKKLYLAGVAVKQQGTEAGKAYAASIILGMLAYVQHYYGDRRRKIIAIAATEHGERLLKSVGAKVVHDKSSRKDGHNLYELIITRDLIDSVKRRARKRAKTPKLHFKQPT